MRRPIGAAFKRLGGTMIDPDIVVPAALPLDLCGESVRARLCIFTDHNNQDMALRPDLTLPVALAQIAMRKRGEVANESVQRYAARAFRQPAVASEPMEFDQVGFERFGAEATPDIDAGAFALVSKVSVEAGVKEGVARFGDLAIVPAFIEAFNLSPNVKAGLRRAFREKGGVKAFLERVGRQVDPFVATLVGLGRNEVEEKVTTKMSADGVFHFADRTLDEVVTRLMEQARDSVSGAVPEIVSATLDAVLELKCAPSDASSRLRDIAGNGQIETKLGDVIETLEHRCARVEKLAPRFLERADFSPSFGRRFTYYDGFVFEIAEAGERQSRPFGAGGRYDRLLSDLSGGEVQATAIGGVVRPDRLALAAQIGGR